MATDKLSDRLPGYQAYLDLSTKLLPLTRKAYLRCLQVFNAQVGDCALADLSPAVLLQWHEGLAKAKTASSTSMQKRAALKKFLEYLEQFEESAQAEKLLRVLARLQVPGGTKPKRESHVLEEVDLLRMVALAGLHVLTGTRDMAILWFLWTTGVRRAEAASLLLDNVDLEERVATVVGKGDKERTVVFDQKCSKWLDAWLEDRDESWPKREGVGTFFININGYPMTPENVSAVVTKCAEEAGLQGQVWAHLFRHSALTRLLDRGVSIQDVAKLAGHANINTTAKYHHAEDSRLKEIYDRATTQ